jgi:hypothetical protein
LGQWIPTELYWSVRPDTDSNGSVHPNAKMITKK